MSLVFITHDFQFLHAKLVEHLHPFVFTNIDQTECSQDSIVLSGNVGENEFKYHLSNSFPPHVKQNKQTQISK